MSRNLCVAAAMHVYVCVLTHTEEEIVQAVVKLRLDTKWYKTATGGWFILV